MKALKRWALVVVVLLACVFTVGTPPHGPAFGAAVVMATQDAAVVEVAAVEAALRLDRPARRLIQRGLGNEGFEPGAPDGLLGPRTREAIRRWQGARGLPATGHLDAEQAELLSASGAPPPPEPESVEPPAVPVEDAAALPDSAPESPAALVAAEPSIPATQATGDARQLPPEILVDRHLVRAERLLAAGDADAALEAMNEILALQQEHDLVLADGFRFQQARAAFAAGLTQAAITSLNEYLVAAGREGEFYREALELLDAADLRLEREAQQVEAARRRLARWPPGEAFRDCDVCPEMVALPGSRLALGRYEVTVGEYRAFASATGGGGGRGCEDRWGNHDDGASWREPVGFRQTDRHPVVCVSWDDAQAYLSWLSRTAKASYRLPTVAEWERVAVGSRLGCVGRRSDEGTCPVGAGASNGFGLWDMGGNVSEWMEDRSRIPSAPAGRYLRGSRWAHPGTSTAIYRAYATTSGYRYVLGGFRVARPLD